MVSLVVVFFFFQAEDGIRDYKVTGVQTCALPIWPGDPGAPRRTGTPVGAATEVGCPAAARGDRDPARAARDLRSEERRVGKSVDLGGRRIIKKKNRHTSNNHIQQEKQ